MLRALLLCALAGVLEATTLKFTFTAVRNDNPKEDIALQTLRACVHVCEGMVVCSGTLGVLSVDL